MSELTTVTEAVLADNRSKYDQRYLAAVDAAAAVFAAKGYHGAGTIDIANKLNIKQGSLYYYFRSKEAALEAVCLEGAKHQVAHLESLLEAKLSFASEIEAILDYTIQSLRDRADYMIVFNNDRQAIPLERRGRVREQSYRYHKLLEQIFACAQERGEMKSHLDVHVTVHAFTSLLSSVSSWYRAEQEMHLESVARHYSEIFLVGAGTVAGRR